MLPGRRDHRAIRLLFLGMSIGVMQVGLMQTGGAHLADCRSLGGCTVDRRRALVEILSSNWRT